MFTFVRQLRAGGAWPGVADRLRVRDAAESVRRDVQRRRHVEILESSVGDPSLNDLGSVAFTADVQLR